MSAPDLWIGYGLPLFGVAFGLTGLVIAWISARRFDARFGTTESRPPIGTKRSASSSPR